VRVRDQLDAAAALHGVEPVASAVGVVPGRPEIVALRHEGKPEGALVDVAEECRVVEASEADLVWRLILPDDEIRCPCRRV